MPGRRGKTTRILPFAAALALGALAVLPQAAMAGVIAPESPASSQASASFTAYVIFGIIGLLIVVGVLAAVLGAVRRGRHDAEPERRTRGTRGVQRRVGIGLSAAVLVLFIVGIFLTESVRDVDASETSGEPVTIKVDGQQWVWRYGYPEETDTSDGYSAETPFSYNDLYVPVDTPVNLVVGSVDVLHRWWVPAIGRAVDAVPGDDNEFTFVADEEGVYEGRSTEFSGPGYSTMRTRVHVVSRDEYDAYIEDRILAIDEARDAVAAETQVAEEGAEEGSQEEAGVEDEVANADSEEEQAE